MPRLLRLLPLLALTLTLRAAPHDLQELAASKDGAELAARVAEARKGLAAIEDPAVRALTQGTLEKITQAPGNLKALLATHAARLEEIVNKVPETLFLTGLTDCKSDAEVVSFARRTYPYTEHIKDPVMARIVRFTLAKLEDSPKDAPAILKGHLKQVGVRFHDSAKEAFAANNAQACIEAIQIAIRCDPENIQARFLFAHLLTNVMDETTKAIQTLRVGLAHLAPSDKGAGAYLDRYFQILESRQEDEEVIRVAGTLLGKGGFDENATGILALHLATCLYWTGRYEDCNRVIAQHRLSVRPQGRLLEARSFFDSKQTEAAIRLLDKSVADFSGAERDAILSQLQRFHTELGHDAIALSIAEQRIRENPNKSSPRVHRLWLLERQPDSAAFNRESRKLLDELAQDQAGLMGMAQLASERGRPGLATDCLRIALGTTYNRPVFALLAMEAHVNAREHALAIELYTRLNTADRNFFKDQTPSCHAVLAAAKIGRGDQVSRREAERHLKAFYESTQLQPDAYLAASKLIRRAGDTQIALQIVEKGRARHNWHNQLRAEVAMLRIMTGQTSAYGTRLAIEDELQEIATGRHVHPRVWSIASTWVETEAKLPPEKLRALQALIARQIRLDIVKDPLID